MQDKVFIFTNNFFNLKDLAYLDFLINLINQREQQIIENKKLIEELKLKIYHKKDIRFNTSFLCKAELLEESLIEELNEIKNEADFFNKLFLGNQKIH